MLMLDWVREINQIVAVGSVDGILTTAALLRLIGEPDVDIVFTQAFAVDKIDPSAWKPARKVAFVDLAVNNRDKAMTASFVRRMHEAKHKIVAICDEHGREDWQALLGTFLGLCIKPESQDEGRYGSSGAVLKDALSDELDEHGRMLCDAADKADKMVFEGVGKMVNEAVKSKITDDTRRVYLARHFAQNIEPDATIQGWIGEYEIILANHQVILAGKEDLGDGIVRVSAIGVTVDMTTLMNQLYRGGAKVVIVEGEMFDKMAGQKVRQVSFGTSEELDLLACVKAVVPSASGFAKKVNVLPGLEEVATSAVRTMLCG